MSVAINKETILKYNVSGPRYTSYPTAPNWNDLTDESSYIARLKQFGQSDKTLSLYIHIPFCQSMCNFCACSVVIRKQEDKIGDEYLMYLFKEIELLAQHIGTRKRIKQLHWGGGTPTFLSSEQITKLFQKLQEHFDIDLNSEVAIEIDPRTISHEKIKTLRKLGFNRVSMGVQDFDEKVQVAVNRIQPFDLVREINTWCRELNFHSVNFDLIYGLAHQTQDSFKDTVEKVIALKPDRIALYSFAYVPWLKKHQTKMSEEDLPNSDEKLSIFLNSCDQLKEGGYQPIAMDHFALKTDELAKSYNKGTLYRNFMGYTVRPADEYIGLGVTSIGFIEDMFIQNEKVLPKYYEYLQENKLPIARGKILSLEDRIRQWTINSLMCRFSLSKEEFQKTWDVSFDHYFADEQKHITACIEDNLITLNDTGISVTEKGKIFIRNICMGFDQYLQKTAENNRFSQTI